MVYYLVYDKRLMNEELLVFFSNFFRPETTKRALKVAFVVAPILIIINHYDAILDLRLSYIFFLKSALTFLVPYCVSAYSSAQAYSEERTKSQ